MIAKFGVLYGVEGDVNICAFAYYRSSRLCRGSKKYTSYAVYLMPAQAVHLVAVTRHDNP